MAAPGPDDHTGPGSSRAPFAGGSVERPPLFEPHPGNGNGPPSDALLQIFGPAASLSPAPGGWRFTSPEGNGVLSEDLERGRVLTIEGLSESPLASATRFNLLANAWQVQTVMVSSAQCPQMDWQELGFQGANGVLQWQPGDARFEKAAGTTYSGLAVPWGEESAPVTFERVFHQLTIESPGMRGVLQEKEGCPVLSLALKPEISPSEVTRVADLIAEQTDPEVRLALPPGSLPPAFTAYARGLVEDLFDAVLDEESGPGCASYFVTFQGRPGKVELRNEEGRPSLQVTLRDRPALTRDATSCEYVDALVLENAERVLAAELGCASRARPSSQGKRDWLTAEELTAKLRRLGRGVRVTPLSERFLVTGPGWQAVLEKAPRTLNFYQRSQHATDPTKLATACNAALGFVGFGGLGWVGCRESTGDFVAQFNPLLPAAGPAARAFAEALLPPRYDLYVDPVLAARLCELREPDAPGVARGAGAATRVFGASPKQLAVVTEAARRWDTTCGQSRFTLGDVFFLPQSRAIGIRAETGEYRHIDAWGSGGHDEGRIFVLDAPSTPVARTLFHEAIHNAVKQGFCHPEAGRALGKGDVSYFQARGYPEAKWAEEDLAHTGASFLRELPAVLTNPGLFFYDPRLGSRLRETVEMLFNLTLPEQNPPDASLATTLAARFPTIRPDGDAQAALGRFHQWS